MYGDPAREYVMKIYGKLHEVRVYKLSPASHAICPIFLMSRSVWQSHELVRGSHELERVS